MVSPTERRGNNQRSQKAKRVAAGAVGGGGTVVLANAFIVFWGQHWTPDEVAAFSAVMTWLGTWGSICAWDVRGLVLSHLRRRIEDL